MPSMTDSNQWRKLKDTNDSGHFNPAIEHHFFNISETEWEGVIQPDAVGNDFGWEAMSFVRAAHPLSII